MSLVSAKVGTVSSCLVWVVMMGVIGTCLIPVALIVAPFTATSEIAVQTIGPLVCPETSAAIIEISNTSYQTDLGAEVPAATREMVCVDSNGTVVARPAPLPNWLWMGFVALVMLLITGLLALALATPAGMAVGTLLKQVQKTRKGS